MFVGASEPERVIGARWATNSASKRSPDEMKSGSAWGTGVSRISLALHPGYLLGSIHQIGRAGIAHHSTVDGIIMVGGAHPT